MTEVVETARVYPKLDNYTDSIRILPEERRRSLGMSLFFNALFSRVEGGFLVNSSNPVSFLSDSFDSLDDDDDGDGDGDEKSNSSRLIQSTNEEERTMEERESHIFEGCVSKSDDCARYFRYSFVCPSVVNSKRKFCHSPDEMRRLGKKKGKPFCFYCLR